MTVLPLLAVGFIMKLIAVAFIICAVVLILVVLIQKGRGGGIGAAFGGAAGGVLGSKTGDFLTWVTVVLVGLFLILAVLLNKFYKPSISDFGQDRPAGQQQPTGTEQPSTAEDIGGQSSDTDTDANSVGG